MQGFYYLIDAGEPEMKKFQRVFKVEADNYVKEKKRELLEKVQQLEQHVESYFVAISQRVTGLIEQETRR
jgi:tagatose-1,6-bisphosphate aldolase